jgi:hypothetical protein
LTLWGEAFTKIGFSVKAARMLALPDNQNITLLSLALMNYAEVKPLCEMMRKPGGGKQGTESLIKWLLLQNHCKSKVNYKEPSEKLKLVKVDKMVDFREE